MAVRVAREDVLGVAAEVVPLIARRVAEGVKANANIRVLVVAMVPAPLLVAAALAVRDAEVPPAQENALVVVIPTVPVAEEDAAVAVILLAIQTVVLIAIVQQNKIGGKRI